MLRYVINRVLMLIPILIGVTLFVFLLMALVPADPAVIALGADATEESLAMFREQHGLNYPLPIQYLNYMWGVIRGDFGISLMSRLTVSSMISARIGYTLILSFASLVFTVVVAMILGIAMAIKQNSIFDNFMRVLTIIFTSMPSFWLALMLMLLFTVVLGWLPSFGLTSFRHAILPVICISLAGITLCARTGRASLLEVINRDYIRTARAKGLKYSYVIRKHALGNSMMPMITIYGRMVGQAFTGSIVIETIFGINGIGLMMVNALRMLDAPVVMGGIIVTAVAMTLANLLTDLAYAFIDPRIKSQFVNHAKRRPKIQTEEAPGNA